ncbi:MAG: polysaccharide deacetylase family protein [Pirellulales bacterium]|nr:polysaccharide deacetylase family protein [Pirellulales bacterium]
MAYRIHPSRWFLKKAARKGLAAVSWASGWLAARRRTSAGPRVRVLTYHRFGRSIHDPFCVAQDDFDAQMRWLAKRRLAVSLADLEAFLAGETTLPDGSVLVTVDDGFRSVYTHMLPVLKRHSIPAVAYVTPSLIRESDDLGAGGEPAEADEAYLTWGELRRLADEGVAIGSHGWTHRSLGRMGPVEVRREAIRSKEVLEDRLERRIASLAYPYGTRADFTPTTGNVLAETGYTTAFTSQHGAIRPGSDPIELPRIKVEGGEGLWVFQLLCQGAMDGWRLVDRTLSRLQQTRWSHPGEEESVEQAGSAWRNR